MNKKWLFTLAFVLILVGIVGMAMNKFKFYEDLVSYEKRWDLQASQDIKLLEIRSNLNLNITFESSLDDTGYINLEGNIKPEHAEILNAFQPIDANIRMDFSDANTFEFLGFDFRMPKANMTIVLPQHTSLQELDMVALTGNIQLNDATADDMNLLVAAGNIELNRIQANRLVVKNVAGKITGNNIQAEAEMNTVAGDIVLKDMEGPLDIQVTTGSVQADLTGVHKVNILCRAGNVKVAPDASFRGYYNLKALAGTVKAPKAMEETNDMIQVETYSGNITIVH
ncbi:DUF4097 family beta strand repeat-containing protein [Paenibacillus sp. JCM 10914]